MAKILVVDDDKLIREGVADMLRSEAQHEVITADDGKAGLKKALAEKPALIISDVRMPKMTGTEMIEALRKDKWGKDVPVIVMSNDEDTSTINDALAAGVTVYLSKLNTDRAALSQQVNVLLGT